MVKTVYTANLKEIKNLKVICAKCKAEMVIPIGGMNSPEKCFLCQAELQWHDINRVLKGIETTVQASIDYGRFEIYIEIEAT